MYAFSIQHSGICRALPITQVNIFTTTTSQISFWSTKGVEGRVFGVCDRYHLSSLDHFARHSSPAVKAGSVMISCSCGYIIYVRFLVPRCPGSWRNDRLGQITSSALSDVCNARTSDICIVLTLAFSGHLGDLGESNGTSFMKHVK